MSKISLSPSADPTRVMDVVRVAFESRDYLWTLEAPDRAIASEGGTEVGPKVVAQRLEVAVRVRPDKDRVVLKQRTVGAAYAANGSGFFTARLAWRFSKLRKAVRADLEAAGLARS